MNSISEITELKEQFYSGNSSNAYKLLGCHKTHSGYVFRVWAPNAASISLVGDFNFWNTQDSPMQKDYNGIWEFESVFASIGGRYKYYITRPDGSTVYKNDPYAMSFSILPDSTSLIYELPDFSWHEDVYKKNLKGVDIYNSPINIYELHAGSWRRHDDGSFLNYSELADSLIPYLKDMNYTHVELLPITEYPFEPSWGYQVTGYFAPTFRYGSPFQFMDFIDKCHSNGIGVILDWVPAHFPKDESGLYEFDGTYCYEVNDPVMNEHPDWNTRIFDYSRYEVRSFLLSSALFWIREYHIDGIRVDAVASMLYLDYGRDFFKPNKFGGNYNLDAIGFLQALNQKAYEENENILMIAEESTAFPLVTKPVDVGGLGFGFKWNMGWMNDMLGYISTDPLFRKGRHNDLTFSMTYAFSENFILPLSHDEVVHGKRSMIEKMPGQYKEKFDNLKVFYSFMIAHPGKKLSFMGNEFAQFIEWNFKQGLDWLLLNYEEHKNYLEFVKNLNRFYLDTPALWQNDSSWDGFSWIIADDKDQSVAAFRRIDNSGNEIIAVFNFCPVLRKGYRIGLPKEGLYTPVFISDSQKFGGTTESLPQVKALSAPLHGLPFCGEFIIPSMSAVYYSHIDEFQKEEE